MRFAFVLAAAVLVAGCPRHVRHTLVPSVPENGDAHARKRYEEARAKFERDRSGGDEMAAIARDYPNDPVAPFARLYAGIADVDKGDYPHAADELSAVVADEQADDGLRTRASLFLGIADAYLGKPADALPLLARGEKAIENDGERGEWTAATATSTASSAHPLDALAWMDRWWAIARPNERGYILARAGEIAGAAPDEAIVPAWQALEHRDSVAAAVLGPRAALATHDAHVRDQANEARAKVGLPPIPALAIANGGGQEGRIGAALPMTGKQERLGEQTVHGFAIAAGALGGPGAANVDVRDVPTKDAAAAAVDALAGDGVIAIVGPIDGESVDAAAARAAALAIPLLSLNARAEQRSAQPFVFHVMHSAEARARTLARRAANAGVKKIAVLAPDSGYGKAIAKAFIDAYAAAGGAVVTRVDFPAATNSFATVVGKLGSGWDAVFIPTDANQLELIAPALDAAGLIPRPLGAKKVKGGRPILVLTTAEGAGPELIHNAGRHLYGAWLAPGFYPDATDPLISDYVARYLAAFNKAPTALDAYAYDAALAIAKTGAISRGELAQRLAGAKITGVTGELRFDADRRRADDGVLFVVEDDGQGGARVKAQR